MRAAPVRAGSRMDFVRANAIGASECKKEIVRARLIHHAVERAHRHLEAQVKEALWRCEVMCSSVVDVVSHDLMSVMRRCGAMDYCWFEPRNDAGTIAIAASERSCSSSWLASATLLFMTIIHYKIKKLARVCGGTAGGTGCSMV